VATHGSAGQTRARSQRPATVLVGRAREQVFLCEELAAALGGNGRLVLLGGEAGIGKTSLAENLTRDAPEHGARVLVGHCYDLTNTPPYGPWLELFDGGRSDPSLPPPPSTFAGGTVAAVTDQAALFAEVRRFFAELAAVRPVIVLLEDLHWADPASLVLLRHLAPQVARWPFLLIATYRADELTRRHPFAQLLPALVREANGLRLDLRPLDAGALHGLVASRYRLDPPDEDRLVAYLGRHAEGNPFFATELLRALQEDALLLEAGGGWSLGELDRVVVPSLVRHVIDGRVARLGEETRQPLAIAAVIGQEVPLALWAAVAGLTDEVLLGIIERAVEAHLLAAERDGERVRFVHALTREALYEGVLPPRRRTWHRQAAEALLASADPDPDAVAYHLQQAGDPRAWEWLVTAGERARRAYAWLTAVERLQAAAALLDGVPGLERTRSRLGYRVGYLKRFSDPAGAIEALDEAERVSTGIDNAVMISEIHWLRGIHYCYLDRFRTGLAEMEKGLELLEAIPREAAGTANEMQAWLADALPASSAVVTAEDEHAMAQLLDAGFDFRRGAMLWFLAAAGQARAATEQNERFLAALADGPGERGSVGGAAAFAYHGLSIAYAALGRSEDARRAFVRTRELFGAFDHHALIAFSLLMEARDVAQTYDAADPSARRRLAAEAEAALGRAGGAFRPGVSPRLAWLGCLVLDGRWQEADQILRDLPAPRNANLRREITAARATLAHRRGDPEPAWAEIRPLFPAGPETEPGDMNHQEGLFLQRLAAELCLDEGNLPGAHAWLTAHDRWLAWSEGVLGRADGQVAWAGYHLAVGDASRTRAAATNALALAAEPDQPLARLAAHRLLGEIETATKNHAAAEANLTVALALAATCEAPHERALTLLALAELRLAMGQVDEAAAHVDEVRCLCTPLGAAPALARAAALAPRLDAMPAAPDAPCGLTPREVEVLRLVADGRSDREIAEALFIGPTTVRTHLTSAFGKLEVGSRTAAVAAARRRGIL
jgi:DNA-binding CsgD family transcriptional regulator